MNKPKCIIIHHSATADGEVHDWKAIENYHRNTLGYRDIGYHYGIERINGKWAILTGRAEGQEGAHTKGMNDRSIGICVVGNFDKERPDKQALFLLDLLCCNICKRHGIPVEKIEPHSKYANKTCPGELFPLVALRESIAKRL